MAGVTVTHFVVLSALLFAAGLFCVVTRRNALGILACDPEDLVAGQQL